ncbi:alpha-1,6-mannosyl-glycoprotein 4-beta-N-acetylglucosaminyltransferase-like isoform X1 [Phyllostomus hastatus]|uniref:alpha-1,6-mannosyl-glycoprotein 4-beta-N-acetylglucosaminyltransferase-like isoform X1 n=1 Tax=Phyllostomus hastatus TaxID=9423 RepID=UPI001E6832EE|nr:alpha-1,6-mannosyl-glycoprotein 4-beta-N-acetylglucosaminyltransferase-like isoform X1 [Phyllostomus hastatus]
MVLGRPRRSFRPVRGLLSRARNPRRVGQNGVPAGSRLHSPARLLWLRPESIHLTWFSLAAKSMWEHSCLSAHLGPQTEQQLCEFPAGTMKESLWVLAVTVAAVLSVFLFVTENPFDPTSFLSVEEKKLVAWQRARMQLDPGRTHHLETFKGMQKNSEPLRNVNSRILIGAPPGKKKLLAIGISAAPPPQGSSLVGTLRSLFSASSSSERKHFTVLLHAAGPDPKGSGWPTRMTRNLSALFKPHVQARELVVITTPLASSLPSKDLKDTVGDPPAHVALRSGQNRGYASLMNSATQLADYFLMVEDDVRCAPGFVTQIATAVSAWAHRPWATLEFSRLGLTGKLFRTGDLPRVARFLLLFHREMPCARLLAHLWDLERSTPVQFLPPLFQRSGGSSHFEEEDIGSPSNPAASVHTSLEAANNSVPSSAYSLDESCFCARSAEAGSHLTVVLDTPAQVSRVQVQTGSGPRGENQLKEGHVELGYDSSNRVSDCDDYVLLGPLVDGRLDRRVLSHRAGRKVKCVRVLVTARTPSAVVLRHIRLWAG